MSSLLSYTFSSSSHSLEDWNKNQRSAGSGESVVVSGEKADMFSSEEEEGSKEETDERRSTASLPVSKEGGEVLDKDVEQSIQVNNCF